MFSKWKPTATEVAGLLVGALLMSCSVLPALLEAQSTSDTPQTSAGDTYKKYSVQICNQRKQLVNLAIGSDVEPDELGPAPNTERFKIDGWYPLAPAECKIFSQEK